MPSLEAYSRGLPYSYALGLVPASELMKKRPELARRLLVSSKAEESEGLAALRALCEKYRVREEVADKALARVSGKENCFAAVVFEKFQGELTGGNHLVLHRPGDKGNLGTMLRTALGFGYRDIALIRPAADAFDPHVVRASMGAIFGLNVRYYDSFEDYRAQFPAHALYPFMLDASVPLAQGVAGKKEPFALIMGNEGSGLPAEFARMGQPVRIPHSGEIDSLNLAVAAAIGMYAFAAGNGS
ncbi:MAG: TrmH family RNA methyltransferase [Clostridia bacterium]|nr:TrmH family RNA methyltransferase [Clostridia bacterium]